LNVYVHDESSALVGLVQLYEGVSHSFTVSVFNVSFQFFQVIVYVVGVGVEAAVAIYSSVRNLKFLLSLEPI
jgi:hypothetical protein